MEPVENIPELHLYCSNPRKGYYGAIDVYRGIVTLHTKSPLCLTTLNVSFNTIVAAKRYFAKEYQSKKYGFAKPIWKVRK